jgi:hypothetical protein
MEEKEFTVKETKDVLGFALTFGSAMGSALQDGKLGITDIPGFLPAVMKLPAAIEGVTKVPSELSHLDESEKEELLAYLKSEFSLPDDKIESAVLDGLKLVADLHGYVQKHFIKK